MVQRLKAWGLIVSEAAIASLRGNFLILDLNLDIW